MSQLGEQRWIDEMAAKLGVSGPTLSVIILALLLVLTMAIGSLRPAVVVEAEKEERERIAKERAAKKG
ncbi:hypothetical protein CcaverHIS002_0205500 [Cutaneotrichosporon cavernicola]|uniref:Uncharacterized protein n=1 Tax=Cutaneotrichosporon cavernicola TaxID=279322 RepID=A0AA48I7A9_9TREE|nr:uncharacterized protein CcaverHIS019_0205470 [Cutaneotrichosporon cavernicola]BEI81390.1 hypothetical protein CcaverHIS002_0205500 [Cutaneotrichosporon cavernicola]BEI89185.1 hypothetical protein CcaverHIS019_0205470 [Cutaneotrichosporon cavernicola]BEI96961.1 hypothetical protein CcaverHIS631_0205500 [Cutaneotrichosporon cavernicola]BEJ04735.1 hypothetical protein CcaverHIS641_0205520 [Cutaneotrichosporon cavernicola]